jgi:tartrate dehydrogenase/decarboxylase/D-malate dehydrogenase
MPGVRARWRGRRPGDIDMLIVRENTEGEYTNVGGACTRAPSARS